MVEVGQTQKPVGGNAPGRSQGPLKPNQLNKLYSLPAPIRTFPLPIFVPHNPISLFHLLYTWVSQTIYPPSSHPETLYQAWLSWETRSVHVADPKSIRALWEQGFYGKGSLSRSEPSWLNREKRKQDDLLGMTSEEFTRKRRDERQRVKWERARKAQEAIDQKLLEERGVAPKQSGLITNGDVHEKDNGYVAPVGPAKILSLPNLSDELSLHGNHDAVQSETHHMVSHITKMHTFDSSSNNLITGISQAADSILLHQCDEQNGQKPLEVLPYNADMNGNGDVDGSANTIQDKNSSMNSPKQGKCPKSVRFSPDVQQTTFVQSEPPSPELAATGSIKADEPPAVIEDKEHLQLTMEEALFLTYGLGVLTILDPKTKTPVSVKELFSLARRLSYFPPAAADTLTSDDPFLLSYVVYHHFRSLGWVVRSGIKFSVDYIIYNRGPVFSHAEFAILIFPSYSDPYWRSDPALQDHVAKKEKKSWSWLHCVNRANAQAKKTVVMVYVDIPPPLPPTAEDEMGLDGILRRYKVREFVLKRWMSNRVRD